jgi:hypothetical protein
MACHSDLCKLDGYSAKIWCFDTLELFAASFVYAANAASMSASVVSLKRVVRWTVMIEGSSMASRCESDVSSVLCSENLTVNSGLLSPLPGTSRPSEANLRRPGVERNPAGCQSYLVHQRLYKADRHTRAGGELKGQLDRFHGYGTGAMWDRVLLLRYNGSSVFPTSEVALQHYPCRSSPPITRLRPRARYRPALFSEHVVARRQPAAGRTVSAVSSMALTRNGKYDPSILSLSIVAKA